MTRTEGCFLIGSGPSLNHVDVRVLAKPHTITFNRAYIAWNNWGFSPTYHACFDPIVLEDTADELADVINIHPRTHFFLNANASKLGISEASNVTLLKVVEGRSFSHNPKRITNFGNVGATSIQVLALLGYRRIVLVGVDARYRSIVGTESEVDRDGLVRAKDDPDHFFPEYGVGLRVYARPDMNVLVGQWPRVAAECNAHGIEVCNASVGSALRCFPAIAFPEAVQWLSPATY